ncbi:unnamed protein product [Effrenium voratum]|uniref:DUF4440 domain-containing protein n=1 Tax=Effrenium voratum TaxID=2562239 RepID=A0AA36NFL5_9DINO|nr:unnamed protein product [Effrenium voratum]CAJ1423982.1 unnamed protein product [Effrenium voratum]
MLRVRLRPFRALRWVRQISVNDPEVHGELMREFDRYERALCSNNVEELDGLFYNSPDTVRYGTNENLHGYEAIQKFRSDRAPPGQRTILHSSVTTYGKDFGVAHVMFQREGTRIGRQSQTWMRTPDGWKVISAHVSLMAGE